MLSLSLGNLTAWEFVLRGLLLVAGINVYVYFVDRYSLRRYPGPFFAKFSYGWMFFTGLTFRRSEIVYQMHKQYGPVVRISPTELSFADPDAFGDLYSRTANAPKSSFYDAFATIGLPSIFATRTADHKPRRRMMYHLFTPAVVDGFAPVAVRGIQTMLDMWETRYAGLAGKKTWFNCLPWCGYLTFDSLSMFLFGHSLGMLNSQNDVVSVAKDTRLNFDTEALKDDHDTVDVHLTEIIGSRETYNYFVGILPAWWKPLGKAVLKGPVRSAQLAAKFTSGLVTRRLARPASIEDTDLVGRMLQRQEATSEVERAPLIAELLTLIVAGSDTTRNSLVSAMHNISRNSSIQTTLQAELDRALPDARSITLDQVKRLPYLEACISETLRIYTAVPGGLPRVAPPGGIVIAGRPVAGGTTVGVHIYSIHREVSVWGEDAEIFRPERWLDRTPEEMKRMAAAFKPFSDGPAACIGKNLAWVQLRVMLASIFRRFTVTPKNPENDLGIDDWFVRRIRGSEIAIQSRS